MGRQQLLLRQELTVPDDSEATSKLLGTLIALRYAGIDRNLLIEMNDSGFSFDEIADYLDKVGSNKC
jgi:hypothetical protein